jgi:hypothetical protein
MGMFDSVHVVCPFCDKETELQSKAGYCRLDNFYQHKVPPALAADLKGLHACDHCHEEFEVYAHNLPSYVSLTVIKKRSEDLE